MPRPALRVLALQHIECEPPGAYEDELRAHGGDRVRVEVDAGEALPEGRDFHGIIVMGGPMGAYEEHRLPWLVAEKRLIADAVAAEMPVWGVCVGAQLLAVGRAYGLQFQLEVGTALATQWGQVPAYAASLEAIMGAGALPRLLEDVRAHEHEMIALARRMFGAWLEHVVGAAGAPAGEIPAAAPVSRL